MSSTGAATKLPMRHLSIRVPWHDSQWNGTVCKHPVGNAECLFLKNIRANRDDDYEMAHAGESWSALGENPLPPCVGEHAGFMAPFPLTRFITHPYRDSSKAHKNFAPTRFEYPRYSTACIPFRWMLRKDALEIADRYEIPLSEEIEARALQLMGFDSTSWVQDKRNQLAMLDTFFDPVKQEKSLCFFYAKQTPLSDDPRRVIIGVGRVTHVGPAVEYAYETPGELKAMLWERTVSHSIRPDMVDGFLLPYHALIEHADSHSDFDLSDYIAYAPEDSWDEFSYGTEHVSHDTAISALLACHAALDRAKDIVPGNWEQPLRWINDQLDVLWKMRGPYPGLGAALTAFGIAHGNLLAYDLDSAMDDNEDPWPVVDSAFENPSQLKLGLEKRITRTDTDKWRRLPDERRALLKLLARFNLSAEQAIRFYQPTEREKARIVLSDAEILANPYVLFERDRFSKRELGQEPIRISTIDRGMFPDPVVRLQHPIPEPSVLDGPTDPRRVRALLISTLDDAAADGDTLWPQFRTLQAIRDLPIEPPCPVDPDLMPIVEEHFSTELRRVQMADGTPAYQLAHLADMGAIINRAVNNRLKGRRHTIDADWSALLDAQLGAIVDEEDRLAREEKAAALRELAASRISVLIGPAGTGKTTLLSVLCKMPDIESRGVTLLAPTGKARVQLETRTGISAQTIAQFLIKHDRYDPYTGIYRLSKQDKVEAGRTIVIDEASMLTEEQLAATIDALTGVDRLILVGDPRQLPPIGSGRPFVDIVARLRPNDIAQRFPRVTSGTGYTELTVRLRQRGDARDDLLLAEWFSGEKPGAGADEIWGRVASGESTDRLRFVKWESAADLHDKLPDVLASALDLQDRDDSIGFEQSLGGTLSDDGKYMYFNTEYGTRRSAAAKVEDWQILSPVRTQAHGVADLNRHVQRHFRRVTLDRLSDWRNSRLPKPLGTEEIIYGDKVINTVNRPRRLAFGGGKRGYVANGEIGVVVGQTNWKGHGKRPKKLVVEFSSQRSSPYDYYAGEFGDESEAQLELAYALTVHKAQGSEFGVTFLVLPEAAPTLSRELLYTALTRQRECVVILYQGDLTKLKQYAVSRWSETAKRLTNLFEPPTLVSVGGIYLEAGLIHRASDGTPVRSKSEVIIADILCAKGKRYEYEKPLLGPDGPPRHPDFTIEDDETGVTVFWEHLGMLHDPVYSARWDRKLAWYRAQDILPYDEGGGSRGVLVTTRDDEQGGIDAAKIASLADKVFGT